jgi:hypothetical protein
MNEMYQVVPPPDPPKMIFDPDTGQYRPETPEEQAEREQKEAEAQAKMEAERIAHEAYRDKKGAIDVMVSELRQYSRQLEHLSPRSYHRQDKNWNEEEQQQNLEMQLFAVQGASEGLRELMPEFFWPKGTPHSEPLDESLRKEARALKARLTQALARIETILEVEEEVTDE